jgi:hypothetical protein
MEQTMTPEMQMRHDLARTMEGAWRVWWIETKLSPDFPDLAFRMIKKQGGCGLIELKAIAGWPVGPRGVRLDHFTEGQRDFLRGWQEHGGNAYLLLRLTESDQWYLYLGEDAARIARREHSRAKDWTEAALEHCSGSKLRQMLLGNL